MQNQRFSLLLNMTCFVTDPSADSRRNQIHIMCPGTIVSGASGALVLSFQVCQVPWYNAFRCFRCGFQVCHVPWCNDFHCLQVFQVRVSGVLSGVSGAGFRCVRCPGTTISNVFKCFRCRLQVCHLPCYSDFHYFQVGSRGLIVLVFSRLSLWPSVCGLLCGGGARCLKVRSANPRRKPSPV